MPASAVRSPVPVTSTRSEPEPFTVPAITFAPACFLTGARLAGDHRLVDRALACAHDTVGGNARARTNEHDVAFAQLRDRDLLDAFAAPSPCTRNAVFGRQLRELPSAPCACEIERISSQCPSSMIVTSVASSSHSGMPGKPS